MIFQFFFTFTALCTILTLLTTSFANNVPTCYQPECTQCFKSCPPFNQQFAMLTKCTRKLTVASSKYASPAEVECKFSKCASLEFSRMCRLAWVPKGASYAEKHARLDKKILRMQARLSLLPVLVADEMRTLSKRRLQHDKQVENKLEIMQNNFQRALDVRKQYLAQREYLGSLTFRTRLLNVRKLKMEAKQLESLAKYWKLKVKTLSSAVRSSPLRLEKARDNLKEEYTKAKTDVKLLQALRGQALGKDQKAILLFGLKVRTDKQIKDTKSTTANVRAQKVFIKEARTEISNLLNKVKREISERKTLIPCGPFALSDIVTNALLSSMSKFF